MQNINSDLIRGNIDTIILKTMENGDMYGLDIIREVENKSSGTYELKQPTLYSCLKRLENKELISSYWLDSEIGGKRHYYKLTDKGREVIQAKQDEWSKSKLLIDNLLGDFDFNQYRLVKKDDYDKIINGKPVIQYVEIEKPVIVEVPSSNSNTNQIDKDNLSPALNEQKQQGLFEQVDENNNFENDNIIDEFENLKSNNLITFENEESENENKDNSNQEKKDVFDNELIYFKPKSNVFDEKQYSKETEKKSPSFKQTSAFEMNFEEKNEQEKASNSHTISRPAPEKIIQQDLFSEMFNSHSAEIDNSINEFSNNISMLNQINTMPDSTISSTSKNIEENANSNNQSNNLSEQNTNNDLNEIIEQTQNGNDLEIEDELKNIHTQLHEDGLLNELNELNLSGYQNKNISFENDDGYDFKPNENANSQNNQLVNGITSQNQPSTNIDTNQFMTNQQSQQNTLKNTSYANENAIIDKKYDQLFSAKEDIDDIIYKNVNDYTSENSREFIANTLSHYKNDRDDEYKQRIDNLSEYAKKPYEDNDEIKYSKDIQSLKEEYKNEGIAIKEFNKEDSFKLRKNYLVINKLNFIRSLILLFGYVFVLSAVFIIMDSTELKYMHDFSFKYFLYAFIPFIIYALYYFVVYIFNPYKKVPAKHSPKIMLIFSSIITIQLLLITYCLNLQMGFYSFTQAGYNHLLWIIPTIVSFAPVVSTLIYYGLYRSKNFNI